MQPPWVHDNKDARVIQLDNELHQTCIFVITRLTAFKQSKARLIAYLILGHPLRTQIWSDCSNYFLSGKLPDFDTTPSTVLLVVSVLNNNDRDDDSYSSFHDTSSSPTVLVAANNKNTPLVPTLVRIFLLARTFNVVIQVAELEKILWEGRNKIFFFRKNIRWEGRD